MVDRDGLETIIGYPGSVSEPPRQTPPHGRAAPVPVQLDVVGIGSALVDVVVPATEADLRTLELVKGSMSLVDRARAESIHAGVGGAIEMSGGSAANTMAGVASLGGAAGFVGKVLDDRLGEVFTREIRAAGVTFEPIGDQAEVDGIGTGRCLVLVTDDADRTMATYLGAATLMVPADVPLDLVVRAKVLYLEGYLWDLPPAIEAMRRAIAAGPRGRGVGRALPVRPLLRRAAPARVPRTAPRATSTSSSATRRSWSPSSGRSRSIGGSRRAEETGLLVAATRGAKGSVVTTPHGPVAVEAAPVERVLDTTGAGDLYAAGFLYGLTHGAEPEHCARLGGLCASGGDQPPRCPARADLRELVVNAGLA